MNHETHENRAEAGTVMVFNGEDADAAECPVAAHTVPGCRCRMSAPGACAGSSSRIPNGFVLP